MSIRALAVFLFTATLTVWLQDREAATVGLDEAVAGDEVEVGRL